MLDFIAYIFVRLLNIIFFFIPISASLWLARRLGSVAFFVNKKRRLITYANLRAAFAKEKTPREMRRITKKVYQNLIETFVEILNLTKVTKRYTDKYVEVVNLERIQNAGKSDRGTILLTAHFGDWELSNLTSAMFGFPIVVLARDQKMKRLNELLNRLRESKGCKVARKGLSTKNILKTLYGKNMVGILSDQDAGRKGTFVNFFGRPTSSHSGPMEIAAHTGALILPNFIVRTHGPYHKLYLEEYIELTGSSEKDIREGLQKFASTLESYIRRYPSQWLWMHKRWKSTPVRTVLVLNDGKQGHLNQSLSVARDIQRARTTQGYSLDDTKVVVIDVKYRSRFTRTILSLAASLSTWRFHGWTWHMKYCLEKESYDNLIRTYSEFVVSCGSSLLPVNIFMTRENNAKNIVIMKPNIFGWLKRASLAIIPEHDNPPRRKNVVRSVLAPNMIDENVLKMDAKKLKERVNIDEGNYIGLLIGGDNPEFVLTKETAKSVIEGAIEICEKENAYILATTSRRTPKDVEAMAKEMLAADPRCKLLVIANEKNIDEAVGGILSLSKVILVSGESISMVSEAVSAGKKTAVFRMDKKKAGMTKHERAMDRLREEGYIYLFDPKDAGSVIEKVWHDNGPVRNTGDKENIFAAVRRLI